MVRSQGVFCEGAAGEKSGGSGVGFQGISQLFTGRLHSTKDGVCLQIFELIWGQMCESNCFDCIRIVMDIACNLSNNFLLVVTSYYLILSNHQPHLTLIV